MSVEGEDEIHQALSVAGLSMKQFNKHLKVNALALMKNNTVIDKLGGKTLKLGATMRGAMIQTRRFKMEWLSVMFAGMALSRVFGGLIKTQLQLFGVMDMLSAMWTVTFLPIMVLITPLLFKMMEAFMNMPDSVKMAISVFIILAGIFGALLMVVGQVMLALGGFKILLAGKGISGVVIALKGFLIGLGTTFLWIAGIAIIVAAGIFLAWKTDFLGMQKTVSKFVGFFKKWISSFVTIIKGVMNIVKGIFSGDFELVKRGIIQIFKGLWTGLISGFNMVGQAIVMVFKGVAYLVYNIFKVLIDGIVWAASKVSKLFGGNGFSFRMPSFQTGGLVTQTGPALLHRGEKVVPKGRVNEGGQNVISPTFNIQASINNDMDVRQLATKLNEYWVKDFERISQSRGI